MLHSRYPGKGEDHPHKILILGCSIGPTSGETTIGYQLQSLQGKLEILHSLTNLYRDHSLAPTPCDTTATLNHRWGPKTKSQQTNK